MTLSRHKIKGRKERRRAYAVHHHVVKHPRWVQLSAYAKLLWFELGLEYFPPSQDGKRAGNNGWLACPYNYLINERGFRSRSTIKEALDELEWFGFTEKTCPGSFPREPARYALTHLDIEQHPDNLVMARRAPNTYQQHDGQPFNRRARKKKTTSTVPQANYLSPPGGTNRQQQRKHSPAKGTKGNHHSLAK